MNVEKIVYEAMVELTGISKDDFAEYQDADLIESGILDSLSISSLLSVVSKKIGVKIRTNNLKRKDFENIGALIKALQSLVA